MKNIFEPNASFANYLIAAMVINSKEWALRIRRNSFRFILLVVLGLSLLIIISWLGILYFLLLTMLIVIDFIKEIISFGKMAINHRRQYPEGIILEFDDVGFRKSTISGYRWPIIPWDSIKLAFDNRMIKNIALYQGNSKEYHLLFAQKMKEADYLDFKNKVIERVSNVF